MIGALRVNLTSLRENQWVLFTVRNSDGIIQFVGIDRFQQACGLMKCTRRGVMSEFFDMNGDVEVTFLSMHRERKDAQVALLRWKQINPIPPMMRTPEYLIDDKKRAVRCVETGEIFPSQQVLADSIGISRSYVSQHMRRINYANTIRGKHYEWVK